MFASCMRRQFERLRRITTTVHYTRTWYPSSGSFDSSGSEVLAMDAGSARPLHFHGNRVKWIVFSDPWSGIATVYLDGVTEATIDT